MQIIKSSPSMTDREKFVFRCFDELLFKLSSVLKYDSVKIEISDKTFSLHENNRLVISIDKNAFYVTGMDYKYTKIILAVELLLHVFDYEAPKLIRDLLVYRFLAKHGFADEMSYYFYFFLQNKNKKNLKDFIDCSLAWLAFSNIDNNYEKMFFDILKNMEIPESHWKKCEKFFNIARKDILFSNNMERLSNLYKKLVV